MKPYLGLYFFIFLSLFLSTANHAQVSIEKLPFTRALLKAAEEDKVLMVIMDAKINKAANKITNERLYKQSTFIINQYAIVIRPSLAENDWHSLANKYYHEPYDSNDTAVGLFFNGKGELVHSCQFSPDDPNTYFNHAFLAKRIASLPNEKDLLLSLQASRFTDLYTLNQLSLTRTELSKPTDDLLEAFINLTPIDSFKKFQYFLNLARFCPVLHSKADSILCTSDFNANWRKIAAEEQASIYQNVNNKTYEKAVREKDYALAHYLIDSTDNNALLDADEKDKPLLRKGLLSHFFWQVQDTASFIASAVDFADNYLMKINLDSLDKIAKAKIKEYSGSGPFMETNLRAKYGSQLNFNAWQFYRLTNEPYLLQKALRWIQLAIDLHATPEAYGAYSLLLYKTGNRKEAIKQQKRLKLDLQNKNKYDEVAKCERILIRMKRNEDKVDE